VEKVHRKVIAEKVRGFRQELGLTQEALAEKADMHWTYISGVERCKYNISIDSIARIAKALQREPYELLK
jgi:transcriptional regulator with XRE-family HTH domain